MERRGRHTLSAQAALQQLSEARVGTHLTGESPRVINPMRPQVAAPCIPRLQPHAIPGCSPKYPVCTCFMISAHAAATLRTRHARSPAAATMVRSVASCSLPNRSHLGHAARGTAWAHS